MAAARQRALGYLAHAEARAAEAACRHALVGRGGRQRRARRSGRDGGCSGAGRRVDGQLLLLIPAAPGDRRLQDNDRCWLREARWK